MTHSITTASEHDHSAIAAYGFWIYLMSDLVMFSALFATYAVLGGNFAGGPGPKELFDLPYVLIETIALLVSSLAFGMTMIAVHNGRQGAAKLGLLVTFALGLFFIILELNEFHHLIAGGHGPERSGFLSAFFALVGTHGLHVFCGLIWLVVMFLQIQMKGFNSHVIGRLTLLSLFWHFLDLVWIGVFSVVYLTGVLS